MASQLKLLAQIGPEILAAASDNDPTNVGTAAVGAGTHTSCPGEDELAALTELPSPS